MESTVPKAAGATCAARQLIEVLGKSFAFVADVIYLDLGRKVYEEQHQLLLNDEHQCVLTANGNEISE